MLDVLNLYCYGYIATPIIEVCKQKSLFAKLDKVEFRDRKWLIDELRANAGYFTVALKILETIGWLERNTDDGYRLTNQEDSDFFDKNLGSLYSIDPGRFIKKTPEARLFAEKIRLSFLNDEEVETYSAKISQGATILPLILALKRLEIDNLYLGLDGLDKEFKRAVEVLFVRQNWVEVESGRLTETGRQLLQTKAFDILGFCRIILLSIEELLFGDHAGIYGENTNQGESFVDSQLDFIAGNWQQSGYYEEFRRHIIDIFNQHPLEKQPQVIVNIGCGNGLLLKDIFCAVRDYAVRGQYLTSFPILLVGVDSSKRALEYTAENLTELKYQAFLGGIDCLDEIKRTHGNGSKIAGTGSLFVCSFIARYISVNAEQRVNNALAVLAVDHPEYYLGRDGKLLNALTVLSCWQQYLLVCAQNIGESSLLFLENHAVPSQTISQQLDRSENFHSESIHCLSHQYLITAEAFIILAASVGLFNIDCVKRYPKESRFCRISFHNLIKRDYVIRYATLEDLPRLYQLEDICWQHTKTPNNQIRARLRKYPQGQFVLEKDSQVYGVIYSQRISDIELLDEHNAENVHELHQVSGSVIQLLAVNIDPKVQNLSYGDQLLEFMLQRCSLMHGIERIVGVTLCKNYKRNKELSFKEYIRLQGGNLDPVLAFHQLHGAVIVKALPNYRPQDHENQGYGVLVVYDAHNRKPQNKSIYKSNKNLIREGEGIGYRHQIDNLIQEKVKYLLGADKTVFDINSPLMEMGLDSADLLILQQKIEDEFNRKLQPGFFFEYNSVSKVVAYLETLLPAVSSETNLRNMVRETKKRTVGQKQRARKVTKEIAATDIAIIGMSCRLPGGIETPDELWNVLISGESVIGSYPEARGAWPASADKPGINLGGFIDRADAFDASFFRIAPMEAQITDPQQRILLELTWACLENANILPETLKGSNTGVFVGASNCDYSRLVQATKIVIQAHHATGSSLAILANRLSYFFDLSGPSLLIDTACSASLVALHTAIQSLRAGECDAALVGGVNLICHPDLSVAYYKAGMLSPDGKCKAFDANANGYVRSEGAVMLLLKPLSKAISEQDRIYAVLKGSAVNHGGLAGGLTVPNPKKQSELLTAAWKNAGISPHELSYIEAHGTGTSLGDPIEIQGIAAAYVQLKPSGKAKTCGIGSVKSNLGHLEAAAGITGLLKVILAMQYQQLPASINFEKLNPKINLDDTPLYILNEYRQWDVEKTRLAGVSSFGSGGANAHVVVEEWIHAEKPDINQKSYLFVVSAKNNDRLSAYVESIMSWIERFSQRNSFADFIYTFQVGRTPMEERLAVCASGFHELREQLKQWVETGKTTDTLWHNNTKKALCDLDLKRNMGNGGLDTALEEKNLEQLALLWVSGLDVDFKMLYGEAPHKISVPSYSFSDDRFWIKSQTEEFFDHPLLGMKTSSSQGMVFMKSWQNLLEEFIFAQDNFSCLSLGFILEVFVSAGNLMNPLLEIVSIEGFKYYPFSLDEKLSIIYETRYCCLDKAAFVELVQVFGDERVLIAEAELKFSEKNGNDFITDVSNTDANWVSLEENVGNSFSLPIKTLNSIFPAFLTMTSSVVSIPKILFYGSEDPTQSMLVALNSNEISLFTKAGIPFCRLSICQAAHWHE